MEFSLAIMQLAFFMVLLCTPVAANLRKGDQRSQRVLGELATCACDDLTYGPPFGSMLHDHPSSSRQFFPDAQMAVHNALLGNDVVIRLAGPEYFRWLLESTTIELAAENCSCKAYIITGLRRKTQERHTFTIKCCGDATHCLVYKAPPICENFPETTPPAFAPPQFSGICASDIPTEDDCIFNDPCFSPSVDGNVVKECPDKQLCFPFGHCLAPIPTHFCAHKDAQGNVISCEGDLDCSENPNDPNACHAGMVCARECGVFM